jgi:hypothetical protein
MDRTGARRHGPRGEKHVSGPLIICLLIVVIALSALALYGLWAFWPTEVPGQKAVPPKTVHFFGHERHLSRESLFFVMIAFAGALGGMVHGLRSLAVYVGNRELRWSWVPFYFIKPVLGASLATLLYIVLRAGLFSPSASTLQVSPYGFAAVGTLAGLFSDQAAEKLKKVAEELFEKLPPGKDAVSALPEANTGDASQVGPTDVAVKGSVNPRGLATSVHFEYGETDRYGNETPTTSVGADQVEHHVGAQLKDLSPDKAYHYRLVAKSDAGTTYGGDRQFKTSAQVS